MQKEGQKGLGRLGGWSRFIMCAVHTHFLTIPRVGTEDTVLRP